MLKKAAIIILTVSHLMFLITGCASAKEMVKDKVKKNETEKLPEGQAANLTIQAASEVKVNATVTLTASAYKADTTSIKANPAWSVSDTNIARLNKNKGAEVTLTGVAPGMAYITAEQNEASAQTVVQVKAAP